MGWPPCARQGTEEDWGGDMPPPKASKPAADQETEWAAQGTKSPGSQPSSYKHFPGTSGQTPWPSHSKGIDGLWDGFWQRPWERQQGIGAMGLECPCTPTPPPPTNGPEPGGASVRRWLLSFCRPRAVFHSGTIFGPRRKRKRKQRKELLFSEEPWPGNDSRACRAREGSHCGIKRS